MDAVSAAALNSYGNLSIVLIPLGDKIEDVTFYYCLFLGREELNAILRKQLNSELCISDVYINRNRPWVCSSYENFNLIFTLQRFTFVTLPMINRTKYGDGTLEWSSGPELASRAVRIELSCDEKPISHLDYLMNCCRADSLRESRNEINHLFKVSLENAMSINTSINLTVDYMLKTGSKIGLKINT